MWIGVSGFTIERVINNLQCVEVKVTALKLKDIPSHLTPIEVENSCKFIHRDGKQWFPVLDKHGNAYNIKW